MFAAEIWLGFLKWYKCDIFIEGLRARSVGVALIFFGNDTLIIADVNYWFALLLKLAHVYDLFILRVKKHDVYFVNFYWLLHPIADCWVI